MQGSDRPGKTVNFEKNQGNSGKTREKIFFCPANWGNSWNFFWDSDWNLLV